ncbi:MAG: Hsp70 family protein [Deltaproteobacteria bacterium]|nr:Hsp70 family protein [Deltaproteobacteria bacterium]
MNLGIDFGTTRTVVACCDRGNYPIVGFVDGSGETRDFFPSVVAERGGELLFGLDALQAPADGCSVLRSFKRLLSAASASPELAVDVGRVSIGLSDLLVRFASALRTAILGCSNLPASVDRDAELAAVIATPANAMGAQRFLTLDAFRRAGFDVAAMLNEPSAAGFEYTHRYRNTLTRTREHIVVYDLGGGTFDASLVRMSGHHHDAVATAGLARLGGDDFDAALADLVLQEAGHLSLPARKLADLRERCREAKEALSPNTRRISIDLEALGVHGATEATIRVADFYEACAPLIQQTIDAMAPVMARLDAADGAVPGEIAGIYVVGGGSCLPAVGRALRERFGRRVHRSPYPFAATAIGLAIASDERAGFELEDRFSRCFGVFREAQCGREISFDPIFTRETRVPAPGSADPVARRRVYRAAHNVGHFRMIECAEIDERGAPQGEITPVADVLFPFEAALRESRDDLGSVPVLRTASGPLIEERYRLDANGIVELRIIDLDTGFERAYRVGESRA